MTEADELRAKAQDYFEHAESALNPWSKCLLAAMSEECLEQANSLLASSDDPTLIEKVELKR